MKRMKVMKPLKTMVFLLPDLFFVYFLNFMVKSLVRFALNLPDKRLKQELPSECHQEDMQSH